MRWIGFIVVALLIGKTYGQSVVVLNDQSPSVTPPTIDIYQNQKDFSVYTVFSDSLQADFKKSIHSETNFGYTKNFFWVQFDVVNFSKTSDWFLSIENPRLYKVALYLKNGSVLELVDFKGLYYISKDKDNLHSYPLFHLKLEDSVKYKVLLKVESNSSIILPIKLQTSSNFINYERYYHIIIFILFGVILTTIIYNLIFSIIARELINFLLAINLLFIFLYFFFAFGYGYLYFRFIPPYFRINTRLIIYCFEIVFSILFTQIFLDLKKYKYLNAIFQGWYVIFAILISILLIDHSTSIVVNQAFAYIHIVVILFSIGTAVFCYFKGYKPALYYLISLIIILTGSTPYILSIIGVTQNYSNFELANLASASIFGLLLTIGLNSKLDLVKREKDKASKLKADNELLLNEINERKKAEQKIRLLSKAVEQSANAIIITNIDGNVEYVNPKFIELTGYSLTEVIGRKSNILNSGLLPKTFYQTLWDTINKGDIWTGVFNNKKKNGELYWESATISPIFDEEGKIVQFLAIKEDITLQKVNEDTLKKSEEQLRELNATKDKFFSIIAHDLGNSFSALTGFSHILLEDFAVMSQDQKIEIITNIYNSSKKTYQLFQNLLIWSRSQTGRIPFAPAPLNLKKVIKENIEVLLVSSESKQIELKSLVTDDIYAVADENMLNTILRNLISNAIKFTYSGGKVNISVTKNINDIEIQVSDTGIGMKKSSVDKLFRIDVNISTSGTSDEMGTGLGLILCKEFVEKHGGKIWVNSQPGEGSKFIFTIPLPS